MKHLTALKMKSVRSCQTNRYTVLLTKKQELLIAGITHRIRGLHEIATTYIPMQDISSQEYDVEKDTADNYAL